MINGHKWPNLHMTLKKTANGHLPLANHFFVNVFKTIFRAILGLASSVANDDFVGGAENHRSDQGSFEAADLRFGQHGFDKTLKQIFQRKYFQRTTQHKKDR